MIVHRFTFFLVIGILATIWAVWGLPAMVFSALALFVLTR